MRDDEELQRIAESIREGGTLTPALARPIPDGGYELISGHRRMAACRILGTETMPVIIREMNDDEAVIAMVDANLQRERILPSEKAFAYKMKLEAMKHQGKSTCGQPVHKSRDDVSNEESGRQVQRYIRLTYLLPELLDRVDNGEMALSPAVELSYLPEEYQRILLDAMALYDCSPSHAQAIRLRRLYQDCRLDSEAIHAIMSEAKPNQLDRPKKNDYQPVFIDANELQKLFEAVKGTRLELPVMTAAFYGLRRGEVLGLKWDAIDFERGTITIKHTVTTVKIDGKDVDIEQDSAKTKSSLRTLPLVGQFRDYFMQVKEAQELNKKICGNSYNYQYDGYVFVNEMGDRMKPNYLSTYFPKFVESHGLRRMRFHDLRHSCASLLLANGVPLKHIQEWLGHSDFSTTANIYAHLDYSAKLTSAQAMVSGLCLPESEFGSKWEQVEED